MLRMVSDDARGRRGGANCVELIFSFSFVLCYCASTRNGALPGNLFGSCGPPCRPFRYLAVAPIMIQAKTTIVELDMGELEEILRRVDAKELGAEDYETIRALIESYVCLVQTVGDKNTTIARLRKMLFGLKTEKTAAVVGNKTESLATSLPAVSADATSLRTVPTEAEAHPEDDAANGSAATGQGKGHGRNGADDYTGAKKIEVPHPTLAPGDSCPKCIEGTVYQTGRPGVVVRLVGQAPVGATVYYLQKLRCNLCGVIFTAEPPEGMGGKKCDATVGSMIALLKYGTGMPFNRAEALQANLGIPLPASTQWDIVEALAERAEPVFAELTRQAAQDDVVYNDDTTVKILEVIGERARQAAMAEETAGVAVEDSAETLAEDSVEGLPQKVKAQRTGTFTSGIVTTREGRRIALFFSGRQHAGENLKDVLMQRAAEMPPPIQMCDALSRNLPGKLQTMLANCLAHGRRQFVDVAEQFPEECRHVLESLSVVYRNDALAQARNLSPEERLLFHQAQSGPAMEDLHVWLVRQLDERRVEPNSGLGKAMAYLLRHWAKLTLFLRVPGAPLDNNLCERALKKAILHRKNALFYKTCHGAHVGDVFMSLIYTCEFCGANPFDYLTEVDRHAGEVGTSPQNWMPWNYRNTLEGMEHVQAPSEKSCQDDRCCGEIAQGAGETHERRAD
jgi:transposase